MKKLLAFLMAFVFVCVASSVSALADDDWEPTLFACVDGAIVDPSEPYKLEKGKSVFVTFYTLDENVDHGYAPIAGWADCYPGGMLSSAGFSVTEGNASDFGYNAIDDWGFGYDPHGFLLSSGDLEIGATGDIDYFLYICENFSWDTFDFITTPHGLTETLTFEVSEPGYGFAVQPQGGFIPAGESSVTVCWETDFTPVKLELYDSWGELIREIPADTTSLELTESETDSFIRAYYSDGENDYIDSDIIVIFSDFGFTVPDKAYPEYGDTSLQLIGKFKANYFGDNNELNVYIYPSDATLVNVEDESDTHPLKLYAGEEYLHYLTYGGEKYVYVETQYSNAPITSIAGEHEFVYIDKFGHTEDFEALADVIDGKIVICNRGDMSFSEKCQNAADFGAAAVIVANNDEGEFGMLLDDYTSDKPAIAITKDFADKIKSEATYIDGDNPYYTGTLSVEDEDTTIYNLVEADLYGFNPYFSDDEFKMYVMIEDWSELDSNAVYKAVVTYTAQKQDYTGEKYDKEISDTTEIIVHNHRWDDGKIATAPTCTQGGEMIYTCTVCNKTRTQPLDALGHDMIIHDGAQETCTETGNKPYCECTRCGNYYIDSEGENLIEDKSEVIIPKRGHTPADSGKITSTTSTKYTKTFTCKECGEKYTKTYSKKANTLTAKGKTKALKFKTLNKKSLSISRKNAIAVSNGKGTVTYAKSSGNKKITVNSKTGNITVKKGLKKGTYKVKIKVKAKGTSTYKALTKTVTVTIKVG